MRHEGIRAVGPHEMRRLEGLLGSFLSEAGLRCAILMDRAGRLLSRVGEADFDGTAFASLAAADFAASKQLASLLGEEEFTSLCHQGETSSMYITDVSGQAVLAALFDDRTTLGMVRLKTRVVLPELAAVFHESGQVSRSAADQLGTGWVDEAEDEIDRLFAD